MNAYRLFRSGYELVSPRMWLRRCVFWGGAIMVGLVAVGFAMAGEYANEVFSKLVAISPWLPFLIVPTGFGLATWLTVRFFPGAQGSGIPQAIAAIEIRDQSHRDRLLSMRIAFGKIIVTLLGLFSGASIGREGPTVQIGASIMHALHKLVRFSYPEMDRGLVVAGGAAGISAAFNTPIAGIVFAIEELSRSYEHRTSGNMITAVIFAGITSLALLGDYTYFGTTDVSISLGKSWVAIPACGIIGGLLGGVFSRILIAASGGFPGKVGRWMRHKPVLFAIACGFLLAIIGWVSGNATYGTGYHVTKDMLEGTQQVPWSFGFLKLLATTVSYITGIPGGIFAPSLSVGAGIGQDLSVLLPNVPTSAVIILGMVAYFTGVVQAPLTSFIIVMEMTGDRDMLLPLMATALIAHAASRLVCPNSLYKTLAEDFRLGSVESVTPVGRVEPEGEDGKLAEDKPAGEETAARDANEVRA